MKDCKDCPSYLEGDDAVENAFSRGANTPMCVRFGHVLAAPALGSDHNRKVRQGFAIKCESYGQLAPVPVSITSAGRIAEPQELPDTPSRVQPRVCNGCVHVITDVAMSEEHGYTVSACSLYGKLIFDPVMEASSCQYGFPGQPGRINEARNLRLLPPYRDGYIPDAQAVVDEILSKGGHGVHDPFAYDSDKEVTETDARNGIRAWREIKDPQGECQSVYLPIFRKDIFTEEQQALIPQAGGPDDEAHPELYVDYAGLLYDYAVCSWELDWTHCLISDPGLGKTEFFRFVAWLKQNPFYRFSFTASTETDDMVGKLMFGDGKTFWLDGRITIAYQTLCDSVCDELSLAPNECKQLLRSMMDNSKQLVLDQGTGTTVKRHPMGRMGIAINPPWDIRNLGSEDFADAETNRMTFTYVPYPDAAVEKHIIKTRCALIGYEIPETKLDKLIKIGQDILEATKQGTFPGSWGIRQQIKVAQLTKFFSVDRAVNKAALEYYDPVVTDNVRQMIGTH